MQSEVLTYQEAADLLKCSIRTIERLVKGGVLTGVRIGTLRRITAESLRAACMPNSTTTPTRTTHRKIKQYV